MTQRVTASVLLLSPHAKGLLCLTLESHSHDVLRLIDGFRLHTQVPREQSQTAHVRDVNLCKPRRACLRRQSCQLLDRPTSSITLAHLPISTSAADPALVLLDSFATSTVANSDRAYPHDERDTTPFKAHTSACIAR